MRFAHLFAELYNRPHMVHAVRAEMIEAAFRSILTGEQVPQPEAALAYQASERGDRNGYRVTDRGVAIVEVVGTLTHRGQWTSESSYLQGYRSLNRRVSAAMTDQAVHAVMLDMESPGGAVAGLFQLTDLLAAADKPIWTHANEYAYSAGYAIAAATQRVIGARTSDVGSIGVIAMLMDQSEFDKKRGVKYTPVYAGARKADYNSHEPVSAEALARLQAEVDGMYDQFVAHVAAHRPMADAEIRATEAGTFNAAEAKRLGLIDDIQNFEDAVRELEQHAARGATTSVLFPSARADTQPRSEAMSEDTPVFTQVDIDAARDDGWHTGLATGRTEGAQAERDRIAAILNHPEAEGRATQAKAFAFETEMDAQTAGKLLAAGPRNVAAAAVGSPIGAGYDAWLAAQQRNNPAVGAASEDTESTVATEVAAILKTIART